MSATENKALVHRFVDEVFNKGNLTVIDEMMATDAIIHHLPGQEISNPDGLKAFARMWRTSFPDWLTSIEEMVEEGNTVVERFTGRGTHQGELQGIAPTHCQVAVPGVVFYRLTAGKIVEMQAQLDVMSLMQQLGVLLSAEMERRMQQEERNKAIVQGVLESIFNQEDTSVFESHPGLSELKKNSLAARAAFPDLRIRIEQQVAEGDLVATHAWLSGTQTGSLFGIAPSGKHLEFQAVSVARVVDDWIVQYNSEVGWLGVFMQLGVWPVQRQIP